MSLAHDRSAIARLEVARVLWALEDVDDVLPHLARMGDAGALAPDLAEGPARLRLALGVPQLAMRDARRAGSQVHEALQAIGANRLGARFVEIADSWMTDTVPARHDRLNRLLTELGRVTGAPGFALLAAEERDAAVRTTRAERSDLIGGGRPPGR